MPLNAPAAPGAASPDLYVDGVPLLPDPTTNDRVRLACGVHILKRGAAAAPRTVDLPCGGTFKLD